MIGILEGGLGLGRNGKIEGRVVKKKSRESEVSFFSSSRKFLDWGHFPICRTRLPGLRNHGSPSLGNYDKDYNGETPTVIVTKNLTANHVVEIPKCGSL